MELVMLVSISINLKLMEVLELFKDLMFNLKTQIFSSITESSIKPLNLKRQIVTLQENPGFLIHQI